MGDCARCGIFTWAGSAGLSGLDGGLWVRHGPRSGLGLLAVGILLVPLGAELWARGTVLDAAWRMERLTGERANERGWENPSPGWTGRCGDEQGKLTRCRRRRLIRGRCVSV